MITLRLIGFHANLPKGHHISVREGTTGHPSIPNLFLPPFFQALDDLLPVFLSDCLLNLSDQQVLSIAPVIMGISAMKTFTPIF